MIYSVEKTELYALLKVPEPELRMSTVDYLELVLAEAAEKEGHRNLLLDLGEVRFADTAALRVIITAANRCRKAGGRVVLLNAHPPVQNVLRLGGVNIIKFAESVEEAEALFES
ncbi:MAG: STAS domain-containing protein [bacterium]|nr:STAS domain-containing protein [bacterium]